MKLFIIGNGFDRAHGLPTSYYDFRDFLKNRYPEFLAKFENYYPYAYSDTNKDKRILWNDFERNLASISDDVIIEEVEGMDLDLEGDYPGYGDTLYYHFKDQFSYIDDLSQYLKQWIQSIRIRYLKQKSSLLTNGAKYITFNYTGVLERTYQIDASNILHIHGSLRKEDLDPIIGHRNEKRINENSKRRETAKNSFNEELEAACNVIDNYYQETYKDTSKLIVSIDAFLFQDYISEIEVIGHSISEVDWDYFKYLELMTAGRANWIVNYFDDGKKCNKEELKQNLLKCGVDEKKIILKDSKDFFDIKDDEQ